MPVSQLEGMAILGGTFDPIHFGHLRSAVEIRETLGVSTIKLIPSYSPPHREDPGSSPEDRLGMLRLAVADVSYIEVDDREILREGKSYSIDTIRSLREESGNALPISLVVGFDAFLLFDQWKDWQNLLDHAHLVVLDRPGSEDSSLGKELTSLLKERLVDSALCLHSQPSGMICRMKPTQMDISASKIRQIFREGKSADYLMPREVVQYIRQHGLYGATS